MIWSKRHGFVFLKTRKTAGSSIEAVLERHCGPDDVVTPRDPPPAGHRPRNHEGRFFPLGDVRWTGWAGRHQALGDLRLRRRFYNHIPAARARGRMPAGAWRDAFKFAFVRNPWDQVVSQYCWRAREEGPTREGFHAFVQNREFRGNAEIYCIRGDVAVDFVGRFEALHDDLQQAFVQAGLPEPDGLPHEKAGHRPRAHYSTWYDDASQRIVAEACRQEIERFGYRFERPS